MKIKGNSWTVLFGGAGREATVFRLLDEGSEVRVFFPDLSSAKLKKSVERIEAAGIDCNPVTKDHGLHKIHRTFGLLSIGYPWLIPSVFIEAFSLALNIHPTLLPHYKGPTSGAYVLLSGEKTTGSTVHILTNNFDSGPIVAQSLVELSPFDTLRSMQRKVYETEPDLLIEALARLEAGISPTPQARGLGSSFPVKRSPADSEVDPSLPLASLVNAIRAADADDFPAFFIHEGEKVCIRLWRPNKPSDQFDLI